MTKLSCAQSRPPIAWILAILLALIFALPAVYLSRSAERPTPTGDYIAYWAAGRLSLAGGNPYDPEQVFSLQKNIGWTERAPRMIWYPPWALAILMPFSLLTYQASSYAWFVLNFGLLLVSADWLWHMSRVPFRRLWPAWLIAVTFAPAVAVLVAGQISVLCLVGIVLFLHFADRERWFAAGAAMALVAIKPQLLLLFGFVLLLWVMHARRWKVLGGLAATLATLMILVWIINPDILAQYLHEIRSHPPDYWITPTIGSILRLLFGWQASWLALIAPALGTLWAFLHWHKHRDHWQWGAQMPWLLFVSLVTAPFAWMFDQVVLLVAVIPAVAWLVRDSSSSRAAVLLGVYLSINIIAFASLSLLAPMEQGAGEGLTFADPSRAWGAWQAPALLLWYYAAGKHDTKSEVLHPATGVEQRKADDARAGN